jgi:hypothetical protein
MHTIEISNTAYEYLVSQAAPFTDTPASVLDRIIAEHANSHQTSVTHNDSMASLELRFDTRDIPNVSFTNIENVSISGLPTALNYWNDVLEQVLTIALTKTDLTTLKSMLNLQLSEGPTQTSGYRKVGNSNVWFQGVDAIRACKSIAILSKQYEIPVTMNISWQNKGKAKFPGKTGFMTFP